MTKPIREYAASPPGGGFYPSCSQVPSPTAPAGLLDCL